MALATALFFVSQWYFKLVQFEPKLEAVAIQAEENSRKIEVGFTKMELEIQHNRDDIIYYIKKRMDK